MQSSDACVERASHANSPILLRLFLFTVHFVRFYIYCTGNCCLASFAPPLYTVAYASYEYLYEYGINRKHKKGKRITYFHIFPYLHRQHFRSFVLVYK